MPNIPADISKSFPNLDQARIAQHLDVGVAESYLSLNTIKNNAAPLCNIDHVVKKLHNDVAGNLMRTSYEAEIDSKWQDP